MNAELSFRHAVEHHRLITDGDRIVLSVSGGIDSMVLFDLFVRARATHDLAITVAHVNHGLRGAASDADEALVREVASTHDCACVTRRWHFDGRGNLQDEARRFRQEFLLEVAARTSSRCIATGHHRDDQVETVILHLLRGAGLRGLRGMPWKVEIAPDVFLIRPLLGTCRADIEQYAAARNIRCVQDASNDSTVYTRNDVRQRLIPLMEEFNPNVRGTVAAMAQRLRDDDDALTDLADRFCNENASAEEGGAIVIQRQAFIALHPAVRRRVLIVAFERTAGSRANLNADQLAHMDEIARGDDDRGAYLLPGAHRFERCYNRLSIAPPQRL